MIVVSDTTPLISLLKINRLDLLERLFGKVFIPDAVSLAVFILKEHGEVIFKIRGQLHFFQRLRRRKKHPSFICLLLGNFTSRCR